MNDNTKKTVKAVVDALLGKKALNVVSMEVEEITPIADCFIIASGNSSVHMGSLLTAATDALDALHEPYKVEGNTGTHWTLIDAGSVVIHIFSVKGREYYKIERIWGDVPTTHYEESMTEL